MVKRERVSHAGAVRIGLSLEVQWRTCWRAQAPRAPCKQLMAQQAKAEDMRTPLAGLPDLLRRVLGGETTFGQQGVVDSCCWLHDVVVLLSSVASSYMVAGSTPHLTGAARVESGAEAVWLN